MANFLFPSSSFHVYLPLSHFLLALSFSLSFSLSLLIRHFAHIHRLSLTSFSLYLLNLFYPVLVFNMYYSNVSLFEKNHSSCTSIYILTFTMTKAHFFYFVYINFASIQNQNIQVLYLYLILSSLLNIF